MNILGNTLLLINLFFCNECLAARGDHLHRPIHDCIHTFYSKNVDLTLEEAKSKLEPLTYMCAAKVYPSLPAEAWFDSLRENINHYPPNKEPNPFSKSSQFFNLLATVSHIFFLKEFKEADRVLAITPPGNNPDAHIQLAAEFSKSCMLTFLKAYNLPTLSQKTPFQTLTAHFFLSAAYTLTSTPNIPSCSLYSYISEKDTISAHRQTALQFRSPTQSARVSDKRLLSVLLRHPQAIFSTQVLALALSACAHIHEKDNPPSAALIQENPLSHTAALVNTAIQPDLPQHASVEADPYRRVCDSIFAVMNLLLLDQKDRSFFTTDLFHKASDKLSQMRFMFDSEPYPLTKGALCLNYIHALLQTSKMSPDNILHHLSKHAKIHDAHKQLAIMTACNCPFSTLTPSMLFSPEGTQKNSFHTLCFYRNLLKKTIFKSEPQLPKRLPFTRTPSTVAPHHAALEHLLFFACGIKSVSAKEARSLIITFFNNFLPHYLTQEQNPLLFFKNNLVLNASSPKIEARFMAALIHGCLLTIHFKQKHPKHLSQWVKIVKKFGVYQNKLTPAHLAVGLRYAYNLAPSLKGNSESDLFKIYSTTEHLYIGPQTVLTFADIHGGTMQCLRGSFNKISLQIIAEMEKTPSEHQSTPNSITKPQQNPNEAEPSHLQSQNDQAPQEMEADFVNQSPPDSEAITAPQQNPNDPEFYIPFHSDPPLTQPQNDQAPQEMEANFVNQSLSNNEAITAPQQNPNDPEKHSITHQEEVRLSHPQNDQAPQEMDVNPGPQNLGILLQAIDLKQKGVISPPTTLDSQDEEEAEEMEVATTASAEPQTIHLPNDQQNQDIDSNPGNPSCFDILLQAAEMARTDVSPPNAQRLLLTDKKPRLRTQCKQRRARTSVQQKPKARTSSPSTQSSPLDLFKIQIDLKKLRDNPDITAKIYQKTPKASTSFHRTKSSPNPFKVQIDLKKLRDNPDITCQSKS